MPNLASTEDLIALFTVPVEITAVPVTDRSDELLAGERALTTAMGSSRVKGFSSGRLAARKLLATLGIEDYPLLVGSERDAVWPPSICGSISHCPDVCVVVVSNAPGVIGLGVDVECIQVLEDAVQDHVLTESEKIRVREFPGELNLACLIFSIKESLFKCLHPVYRQWIDFQQAEVTLDTERGSWTAELDSSLETGDTRDVLLSRRLQRQGRFLCTDSHVYSSCELHWLPD